jgi:hypothetical protein
MQTETWSDSTALAHAPTVHPSVVHKFIDGDPNVSVLILSSGQQLLQASCCRNCGSSSWQIFLFAESWEETSLTFWVPLLDPVAHSPVSIPRCSEVCLSVVTFDRRDEGLWNLVTVTLKWLWRPWQYSISKCVHETEFMFNSVRNSTHTSRELSKQQYLIVNRGTLGRNYFPSVSRSENSAVIVRRLRHVCRDHAFCSNR